MKKDILKNYCSTIDTKTYRKIEKGLIYLPLGILATDVILTTFVDPQFHSYLSPVYCASITSGILASTYNGRMWTTDVQELRSLYDDFIKKYNELNKLLGLKDPYEIQLVYQYLYKNGYLSKDKNFEFNNRKHKDISYILGTEVINGSGVCRHIASLLSDILNDYGILSTRLGVNTHYYYIDLKEKGNMSKEEVEAWARENIVDEDRLSLFLYSLSKTDGQSYKVECVDYTKLHPISKLIGNHAITYANYDGKSYYLDPTQDSFYRRSDKNGSLYDFFNQVDIKNGGVEYDKERYKKCIKLINEGLPSISFEEQKEIENRTNELIISSNNLFEEFYKDNEELYSDISSKLLKIK